MATYGKPDRKGRSSGKMNGKTKKLLGPPEGESWVWLIGEWMASDAWRLKSHNCTLFIDRLLIEHTNHVGLENGRLKATYDDLEAYGIRRRSIRAAIEEAKFLGFVRVTFYGGRWAMTNSASQYRLTFYPTIEEGVVCPASNEWKGKTAKQIMGYREKLTATNRAVRRRKKQNASGASAPTVVALAPLRDAKAKRAKNESA